MQSLKFRPVSLEFHIVLLTALTLGACGDSMEFKETELGRFVVDVTDSANDPNAEAGTFAIEDATSSDATSPGSPVLARNYVEMADAIDDALAPNLANFGPGSESESGNVPEKGNSAAGGKGPQDSATAGNSASAGGSNSNSNNDGGSSSGSASEPSDQQIVKLCSNLFKGKGRLIKMIDASQPSSSLQMTADTVLAVRLSGNQAKFAMTLNGSQKIAGLCIVATGNMPSTDVTSMVDMNQIAYVGRGNQSQAGFNFAPGVGLDSALLSLKGNSHQVALAGVGAAVCDSLEESGHGSSVSCN